MDQSKKISLIYSLGYCIDGLRQRGVIEARRRFSLCLDFELNKWIGPIYEKPVVEYYKKNGITPIYPGGLSAGLSAPGCSPNRKMLFYYAYAIKHLLTVPGIPELLSNLANIGRAPDEEKTHEGERGYHNNMVELHGCYFIHQGLKMEIKDVEYDGHFIHSPNCIGNSSCDIKGHLNGNDYYFECKDSSKEIVKQEPFYDVFITSPRTNYGNREWLEEQMQAADKKGADYLLAKIPLWSQYKNRKRDLEWMKKVFPYSQHCGRNEFLFTKDAPQCKALKGVYILTLRSALKIICNSKSAI